MNTPEDSFADDFKIMRCFIKEDDLDGFCEHFRRVISLNPGNRYVFVNGLRRSLINCHPRIVRDSGNPNFLAWHQSKECGDWLNWDSLGEDGLMHIYSNPDLLLIQIQVAANQIYGE